MQSEIISKFHKQAVIQELYDCYNYFLMLWMTNYTYN